MSADELDPGPAWVIIRTVITLVMVFFVVRAIFRASYNRQGFAWNLAYFFRSIFHPETADERRRKAAEGKDALASIYTRLRPMTEQEDGSETADSDEDLADESGIRGDLVRVFLSVPTWVLVVICFLLGFLIVRAC